MEFSFSPGYVTVKELGLSSLAVADRLGITQPAVNRLAQIGEKPPIEKNLLLENRENNKIIWPSHSPIRSFFEI